MQDGFILAVWFLSAFSGHEANSHAGDAQTSEYTCTTGCDELTVYA